MIRSASLILCTAWLVGCGEPEPGPPRITGADAQRGAGFVEQFDCGACHLIPGIRGAVGRTGPTLHGFARRPYLAGKFPNDPGHLVRWIIDPPAMAPRTAMPALGMKEAQARDMAAFLYTLQ